jgi:hypothetical protein
MFNGFSTLGAVALRIMDDYIRFPMKRDTRYTVEQAIQRICFDEQSIASMGNSPAYMWCWFDVDEDGEAYLHIMPGKLASGVKLAGREDHARRYVAVEEDLSAEELLGAYWDETDYSAALGGADRCMLMNAFNFQQRILCRFSRSFHTDSWSGEVDQDDEGEIIYVEPATRQIHIPLTNPMIPKPRYNKPGNQFSVV